MTSSAEPPASTAAAIAPLGARWHGEVAQAQERALDPGSFTVSCSAPLGVGGLGRHMKELHDALVRRGQPTACLSGARDPASPSIGGGPRRIASQTKLLGALPLVSAGLRTRAFMADYDRDAAARLPSGEHLIAFNGQAQAQFRAARSSGYESVRLVSANSHLRRVLRQHARAHRQYPLEGSWAAHLLKRNLAEYEQADQIYVASNYTVESFLEQGFGVEKLRRFPFTPDPRYTPAAQPNPSQTFDVVYIGSLSVVKGVALLIDAFRAIPHDDIRLRLVGGWGTRGMRRFVQSACAADERIVVCPGDPLPHLHAARLCVHPSYEDGFSYAPAEALACGVPILVTEDTGMKDLIEGPGSGIVLPTGDGGALTEAIEAAYREEIFPTGRA